MDLKVGDAWKYISKVKANSFDFVICGIHEKTVDIIITENQSIRTIKQEQLNDAIRTQK